MKLFTSTFISSLPLYAFNREFSKVLHDVWKIYYCQTLHAYKVLSKMLFVYCYKKRSPSNKIQEKNVELIQISSTPQVLSLSSTNSLRRSWNSFSAQMYGNIVSIFLVPTAIKRFSQGSGYLFKPTTRPVFFVSFLDLLRFWAKGIWCEDVVLAGLWTCRKTLSLKRKRTKLSFTRAKPAV